MRREEKKRDTRAAREVDFILARVGPTSAVLCSKDTPANKRPKALGRLEPATVSVSLPLPTCLYI